MMDDILDDILDLLKICGMILAGVFLVFGGVFCGVNQIVRAGCYAQWHDSGFPTQYSFLGGCRISRDGGHTWIPDDAFKTVAIK